MEKTLVIAEKPSVAKDLAKVLGKLTNQDGYLENDRYLVTWAIGHLVELAAPEEYNAQLKAWSLSSLPIIPQEFQLVAQKKTVKQFRVVQKLLHHPDVFQVINACDAGREGELIFYYIYRLSKAQLPIQRLWISSLTQEAIQAGFSALRDGAEMVPLREAALCRSESDWLVGINATRGLTQKCGTLLSVGRVQTPTLALLVNREAEITNFVPQPYWQVEALFACEQQGDTVYKGVWFRGKVDRFSEIQAAQAVAAKVTNQQGKIQKYTEKEQKQPAPLLFDLTELQREMNKRFGFSAKHTLEVAQALYEQKKLLTYPRTDSRYVSKDMIPTLKKTLIQVAVGDYRLLILPVLQQDKLPVNSRIVNDAKVSDHHAIIPTPKSPDLAKLSKDELQVYNAVVRRFIAVFYPPALLKHTEVITLVQGETFMTKNKVLVEPGWRGVYGAQLEEDETGNFPRLAVEMPVIVQQVQVLSKETQPPKRFTEATLLSAMETAGKLIEDEELQEAMKESGIGTPATRAAIIERLLAVGYLIREKKNLIPTDKGKDLIRVIPVAELASPELTGVWEKKMADIQKGLFTREQFMVEINQFIRRMIKATLAMPFTRVAVAPDKSSGGAKVPKTTTAKATRSKVATQQQMTTKPQTAARVIKTPSGSAKGEKSGEKDALSGELGSCPLCGGQIIQGKKGYGCANWRQGCKFVIWQVIAGKQLTISQLQDLLSKKKTSQIQGFTAKSGRKFAAYLVLVNGEVKFEF
jgi:DNA topoisomerase-3